MSNSRAPEPGVLAERRGRVLVVTINRPAVLNAIDPGVSALLRRIFCEFRDDAGLTAAVLTGAGARAFSTGNDLSALTAAQRAGRNTVSAATSDVPFAGITRDFDAGKVIVAAVNGYCLAGGLELALACDIRIAGTNAVFGLPEVTRGLVPGAGATQRLPRLIGVGPALEMISTGAHFDAAWALHRGLVNKVVPPEDVVAAAVEVANAIDRNGPVAVRLARRAVIEGLDLRVEDGLALERDLSRQALATWDAQEGPRAFVEKRPPRFRGE